MNDYFPYNPPYKKCQYLWGFFQHFNGACHQVALEKKKTSFIPQPVHRYCIQVHANRKSILEVEFVGEEGTGLGPTLEFFALVAGELQRKDLGLWLCDDEDPHQLDNEQLHSADESNGRLRTAGYYVSRSSGLFPAPLPQNSEACDRSVRYYWFLGVFLAKVLQDNRLVDLPLSRPFLKLMCRGDIANNVNERIGLTSSNVQTQESMSSSMASSFISEEGDQDDNRVSQIVLVISPFFLF